MFKIPVRPRLVKALRVALAKHGKRVSAVEEALFIEQLLYWSAKDKVGRLHEGRKFIHNSYEQWADQLGITRKKFASVLSNLRLIGMVAVEKLDKQEFNQRNHIAVIKELVTDLLGEAEALTSAHVKPGNSARQVPVGIPDSPHWAQSNMNIDLLKSSKNTTNYAATLGGQPTKLVQRQSVPAQSPSEEDTNSVRIWIHSILRELEGFEQDQFLSSSVDVELHGQSWTEFCFAARTNGQAWNWIANSIFGLYESNKGANSSDALHHGIWEAASQQAKGRREISYAYMLAAAHSYEMHPERYEALY